MNKIKKRFIFYIVGFFAAILVYSLVYSWGMSVFDGRERTFLRSLQVVVETFTTTGYGEDAPWTSPQMVALVILMQFSGIILIFLALPLFIIPWIEHTFGTEPPTSVRKMEDHVIFCGYTKNMRTLIDEFETRDVDYVIISDDEDEAIKLDDLGFSVIFGRLESLDTLNKAFLDYADTLVVNSTDEENANIILTVKEEDLDLRIVSIVRDISLSNYLRYAGADEVISPKYLLGRALAEKASAYVSHELGGSIQIGEDFEIVEISVDADSSISGSKFSESSIREKTGTSVIGVWDDGEFLGTPFPDLMIDDDKVLLVAGKEDQLEELRRMASGEEVKYFPQRVTVVGLGSVGSVIVEKLKLNNTSSIVLDKVDKEGVDVVGDAKNEDNLIEAGLKDVSTLIIALPDDIESIFTILASSQLNPDLEIICRANQVESVGKMYKAGADYVLSLESISGRILAMNILGEDVLSLEKQIKIIRTSANDLAGKTLKENDIRSKVGCIIVAVQREGEILTELNPDFMVEENDEVIVAGTDRDINKFLSGHS